MKVQLGYVSSPFSLKEEGTLHTINYFNYQKLNSKEAKRKLHTIIEKNLHTLETIFLWNQQKQIHFYRFSHTLIPLSTHPKVHFDYITPYASLWSHLGNIIRENHLRVDTHPNQFCVLNSIHESIVKGSIEILRFQQKLFQAMNVNGKAILHVGSSQGGKEEAMKRFEKNFLFLPKKLQKIIILENDDKVFQIEDVLFLCEKLQIPMVLDYHHYRCNHTKTLDAALLKRIFATWDGQKLVPKLHFSSPKNEKEKRSHSELLHVEDLLPLLTLLKEVNQDVDIMLEAKGRDLALFELVKDLKEKTEVKWMDNSSFLL